MRAHSKPFQTRVSDRGSIKHWRRPDQHGQAQPQPGDRIAPPQGQGGGAGGDQVVVEGLGRGDEGGHHRGGDAQLQRPALAGPLPGHDPHGKQGEGDLDQGRQRRLQLQRAGGHVGRRHHPLERPAPVLQHHPLHVQGGAEEAPPRHRPERQPGQQQHRGHNGGGGPQGRPAPPRQHHHRQQHRDLRLEDQQAQQGAGQGRAAVDQAKAADQQGRGEGAVLAQADVGGDRRRQHQQHPQPVLPRPQPRRGEARPRSRPGSRAPGR